MNLLIWIVVIILITQPSQLFGETVFSETQFIGVLIMLASAFLQTFVYVLILSFGI